MVMMLIVFFGLFQFVGSYSKIKSDFIPFVTITSVSLIVFMAGILNLMIEATILIVLLAFGTIYSTFKNKGNWVELRSAGIYFFVGGMTLFAVLLFGQQLTGYDDFSHWGLVAREMIISNRFPNFSDSIITFQAYPTGTASFIYFVAKIVGTSEGIMLWAQSLILLAGITPLFVYLKNKNLSKSIDLIFYAVFLLFSNNGIQTLYVDTILTSLSVGTIAIIVYYLDCKDTQLALMHLFLGNGLLVVTKNSGSLFAIANIVLFLILMQRSKAEKVERSSSFLIILPFVLKFLWDKHVELVFPAAASSKHSMNLGYFSEILGGKTVQDIMQITFQFFIRSLNIMRVDVAIVLFISLFFFLRMYIAKKNNDLAEMGRSNNMLTLFLSFYGVYQIGLLLMYILSMPLNEAKVLASYTRYNLTLSVFLLGIFLIYCMREKIISSAEKVAVLLVCVLLSLTIINPVQRLLGAVESPRHDLNEISSGARIQEEIPVYVYIGELSEDYAADFLMFQFRYELGTKNIHFVEKHTLGKLYDIKGKETTLIILQEDEEVYEQIRKVGLAQDESITILDRSVE